MKSEKMYISFFKAPFQFFIKTILGIFALIVFFSIFYWYNNRLFLWEARLIWPQKPFSQLNFKTGSTEDRAHMTVDLIRSQKLHGTESDRIHELLGEETGDYYYSDSNFTYRLTNKGNADWVLTLITGNDGKIERAFIRKSCCSISRKILYFGIDISEPIVRKLLKK